MDKVVKISKSFAENMKSVLRSITDITKSFLKWTTLGVGAGLLGLGGGLWGLDRIAASIANSRRTAMGLGIPYSSLTAMQTLGPLFLQNPEAALANLTTARTDVRSDPRRAFSILFGGNAQAVMNKPDAILDFMEGARKRLEKQPEGTTRHAR